MSCISVSPRDTQRHTPSLQSKTKGLRCPTFPELVLSLIGPAGQQQSAPGPVDRPRWRDGAGRGAMWCCGARGF